jgi:glutamyl-tRNA reductase
MQAQELERALQRINNGERVEEVLEAFARALTNKLIHEPTIAIREASAEGRHEVLDYVRALYGLDKPN